MLSAFIHLRGCIEGGFLDNPGSIVEVMSRNMRKIEVEHGVDSGFPCILGGNGEE